MEPSLHPHAPLVIEALKPKRALPHLKELKQVFGLKANKGDADYHEAVVWLAASGTCIAAHCPTSRSSASASASGKTKGTQTTTGR